MEYKTNKKREAKEGNSLGDENKPNGFMENRAEV